MIKKKVFFVIPTMNSGGAEKVFSLLLANLDSKKFELFLILLKKEGKFLKNIPSHVNIISLNTNRVRNAVFKLISLSRRMQPDIIFSGTVHLNLLIIFFKKVFNRNIRFIARETIVLSCHLENRFDIDSLIVNYLVKKLYKYYDLIICQSLDMKNDLLSNYKLERNKLLVISNPISSPLMDFSLINKRRMLNDGKYIIVAIGRLTFQKGFDYLINAFAIVNKKIPSSILYIIGDGEDKHKLEKMIDDYHLATSIKLLGFIENPSNYIIEADVMAFSSRYEGFPNTVLESISLGTPVVAFDSPGGLNEIIINDFNGWLVPRGDINAFAETLIKARDRVINSDEISADIVRRYNLEMIVNKYEAVLYK